MKKIVRRGLFMILIYAMAICSTLFATDRMAELDSVENPSTINSISIKLSR